jgi:dUTP pyrophosphatase
MQVEIFPRHLDYLPQQNKETDAGYDLKACCSEKLDSPDFYQFSQALQGKSLYWLNGKLTFQEEFPGQELNDKLGILILPNQTRMISVGFKVRLPKAPEGFNSVMLVYPRSGLGVRSNLVLANSTGIIDQNYTAAEVQVSLYNYSQMPHFILDRARVAQALFTTVARVDFTVAKYWDSEDDRGGGLGSSGV